MTNEVQIVEKEKGLKRIFASQKKAIESVLPKHLTPKRVLRVAYSAITRNPKLMQCTEESLINCVIGASILGLEIGNEMGLAYLLPFNRKFKDDGGSWHSVVDATLVIGYKGYIRLGYNSDRVDLITFQPVYENDDFDYCYGLDPDLKHKPAISDRGKLLAAYAIVKYKNAGTDFYVVHESDANEAMKRSPSHQAAKKYKKQSPWDTDPAIMWCKTAMLKLSKRMPLETMHAAAAIHEAHGDNRESPLNYVATESTGARLPSPAVDIVDHVPDAEKKVEITEETTPEVEKADAAIIAANEKLKKTRTEFKELKSDEQKAVDITPTPKGQGGPSQLDAQLLDLGQAIPSDTYSDTLRACGVDAKAGLSDMSDKKKQEVIAALAVDLEGIKAFNNSGGKEAL